MDFGSVGGTEPDFIAARSAVIHGWQHGETVDEAPGHVFRVRFERCPREHDKHVGPDKGLLYRLLGNRTDRKVQA